LHQRQQHDEPTDSDIITVYEGVSFSVDIWETREVEIRKLRCARDFLGGTWQDGEVIVEQEDNPGAILPKRDHVPTQAGIEIARTPDATRVFGTVQLIFVYEEGLFLLIEALEGANVTKDKRKKKRMQVKWQNALIPNWHHLRTETTKASKAAALSRRLHIRPLGSVERVVIITPDPNQPADQPARYFWSPRNEDCVLSDMIFRDGARYERFGDTPTVAFEDAASVQPRDLVPPSSFQSNNRDITMDNGDFTNAAQTLELADRPYGDDDEGSDRNNEDDSEDD